MRRILHTLTLALIVTSCIDNDNSFVLFKTKPSNIIIKGKPKLVRVFTYIPVINNDGIIAKGEFSNKNEYLIDNPWQISFNNGSIQPYYPILSFSNPYQLGFDAEGRNIERTFFKMPFA